MEEVRYCPICGSSDYHIGFYSADCDHCDTLWNNDGVFYGPNVFPVGEGKYEYRRPVVADLETEPTNVPGFEALNQGLEDVA